MKIRLSIEYHGAEFVGWQYQPQQRSVEAELVRCLRTYISSFAKKQDITWDEPLTLSCSGRTDSGVHARGQAVSFRWPEELEFQPEDFLRTVNGIAPADLSIREASTTSNDFDARKSPHIKCYKYYFQLRSSYDPMMSDRTWLVDPNLNISKMLSVAQLFLGTHDFVNFQSADSLAKTTVRTLLSSELNRQDCDLLVYTVVAKGFLKNMVRILAATLVQVGREELSIGAVEQLLNSTRQEKSLARAPAHGLSQEWVKYLG